MRFFAVALLTTLFFSPSAALAATVRVALVTSEPQATVTAYTPIIVEVGEETLVIDGPVTVVATAERFLVDGRPWPVNEVTLSTDELPLRFQGRSYRGEMRIVRNGRELAVVNHVDLEDYVAGVIGVEMSPTWPLESLKAQAVASRSYVAVQMTRPRGADWDVCATVASQVYRGLERESGLVRQAVTETGGIVALYNGAVAETFFHSSAGGRTSTLSEAWNGKDRPYLVSTVADHEGGAPFVRWRVGLSGSHIREQLAKRGIRVGAIRSINPSKFTKSGRVATLRIVHDRGEIKMSAGRFREMIGQTTLRSSRFSVSRKKGQFVFVGNGFGHGVGMSQFSARGMALKGATFDEIVTHFYAGVSLEPLDPSVHLMAEGSPVVAAQ
ncbi:MAG: SpoIID/LytB domain-containing protein [Nitrospinae bacterium]|nr:SpoIID/LytB domain-containing protein [Nitrospinota bacterium]